jgi:DegV family protein with EDD domain
VVEKLGITVVPLYINFGEKGYLDGVEMSRETFYTRLPDADPFPSTGTPGPTQFQEVYERLSQEGATDILSIHISESLSATGSVAQVAAKEVTGVNVTVLDSRQLSLGTGFLVETAAQAALDNRSMEEILAILEDQISRTHVFAVLETMEFLRRSGRLSGIVASIGSLLQIKPLLKMFDGTATSERVRTNNGATKRLITLLEAQAPYEKMALVHTHSMERAEAVRQQAQHLLPEGELHSVDITPVIGANIGPGAVGFACISAKES